MIVEELARYREAVAWPRHISLNIRSEIVQEEIRVERLVDETRHVAALAADVREQPGPRGRRLDEVIAGSEEGPSPKSRQADKRLIFRM